jgi:hypothetical protein
MEDDTIGNPLNKYLYLEVFSKIEPFLKNHLTINPFKILTLNQVHLPTDSHNVDDPEFKQARIFSYPLCVKRLAQTTAPVLSDRPDHPDHPRPPPIGSGHPRSPPIGNLFPEAFW